MKTLLKNRELSAFFAIVALFVVLVALNPAYFSLQTLAMIFASSQILCLLALGATLVMLTRNIDVSVGSTVGLCAIAVGVALNNGYGLATAIAFALAIGALAGAFNGLLVVGLRIPAIVATLGTLGLYRGVMLLWTGGKWIEGLPDSLKSLSEPAFIGVSPLGWLVLALMLECRIPFKSQFRTFFLSPMMVPVASIILVWQVLFHSNGVVNEFLSVFGVKAIDWLKSDYCMVVIVLLFLWKNLGYNMILFMAALNNIPKELLEVAEVEGASKAYQFFHIKLRYLSPTVLFVTILSIINSFKVFREIYLLSGDYPYEGLYMLQHFMNNMYNKNLDYQRLSAAAIMLAVVIIALIALLFAIENYFGKDVEG